jgi:hypothetical protein
MQYIKDEAGAIPPRVEVFGQQLLAPGDFRQIT